ncbi:MAG: hypothetical protein Q8K75_04085 [Chlamydiales bacterium]|nr:hypothetical protein [Chlamydiales bacterium]
MEKLPNSLTTQYCIRPELNLTIIPGYRMEAPQMIFGGNQPTASRTCDNILATELTQAPIASITSIVTQEDKHNLRILKNAMEQLPGVSKAELINAVWDQCSDIHPNSYYQQLAEDVIDNCKEHPAYLKNEIKIAYQFLDWGKTTPKVDDQVKRMSLSFVLNEPSPESTKANDTVKVTSTPKTISDSSSSAPISPVSSNTAPVIESPRPTSFIIYTKNDYDNRNSQHRHKPRPKEIIETYGGLVFHRAATPNGSTSDSNSTMGL